MSLPDFKDTQRRYGLIQEDSRRRRRRKPTSEIDIGGVNLGNLTDEQLELTIRECQMLLHARRKDAPSTDR